MMSHHECTCHPGLYHDTLIPQVGVITDIRRETPDVKTFRVERPEGGKLFEYLPGQCAMLCVPGVGEAMFSITSSPTNKLYQEFSIKMCGTLTEHLHSMEVGDQITVRGPYGNNRTSQLQRFRQRFMHKLVYFPANNDGMYSCVGCGRCVDKCPSHLNIVKVIKAFGKEGQ